MVRGAAVIANSRYTARLITERYGTPAERIAIIPRGTDLRRFDPATVDDERRDALRPLAACGRQRVVLNLARLTDWKGQRVLIEAAAIAALSAESRSSCSSSQAMRRAGRLPARAGSADRARPAGRFRIVGHCEDVPAALALADVAVIASTEPEAFGRTAVEARRWAWPSS